MRRWLVLLSVGVLPATGGCGKSPGLRWGQSYDVGIGDAGARQASEYLQGFMDGYNSAFPKRGYRKDLRAYHEHRPCHPARHYAYRSGWDSGHRTGTKDERQRP